MGKLGMMHESLMCLVDELDALREANYPATVTVTPGLVYVSPERGSNREGWARDGTMCITINYYNPVYDDTRWVPDLEDFDVMLRSA